MIQLHHDGLSRPLEAPRFRVLSMGAGVQSTTLALMAERGELGPKPDLAIFADTQAEPAFVYEHLDWLDSVLSFPIQRVTIGNLEADLLGGFNSTGQRYASIPAFLLNDQDDVGMTRRQCTAEYKLDAITLETRRLLGLPKGRSIRHQLKLKRDEPTPALIEMWIGISTDEIDRVARSHHAYVHNRHPLIEARMSRRDCIKWLEERQYRVPRKSACVFCPYKDNSEWLDLKVNAPAEFERAVRIDKAIRNGNPSKGLTTTTMALHRSLKPLEDIDFTRPDASDQRRFGFANDCLGMCGL